MSGLVVLFSVALIFSYYSKSDIFLPGNSLFSLKNTSEGISLDWTFSAIDRYNKAEKFFVRRIDEGERILSKNKTKNYKNSANSIIVASNTTNSCLKKIEDENTVSEINQNLVEKYLRAIIILGQYNKTEASYSDQLNFLTDRLTEILTALPENQQLAVIDKNKELINEAVDNNETLVGKISAISTTIAGKITEVINLANNTGGDGGLEDDNNSIPDDQKSINSLSTTEIDNLIKTIVKDNYLIKSTNVLKSSGYLLTGFMYGDFPVTVLAKNTSKGLVVITITDENMEGASKPAEISNDDWQWLIHYIDENATDGIIYYK